DSLRRHIPAIEPRRAVVVIAAPHGRLDLVDLGLLRSHILVIPLLADFQEVGTESATLLGDTNAPYDVLALLVSDMGPPALKSSCNAARNVIEPPTMVARTRGIGELGLARPKWIALTPPRG